MALDPPWHLRELREESTWSDCVAALGGDWKTWDEALTNLTWKLSRDAEGSSFPLSGRQTRITFTEELRDTPVLRVLFWIEGDTVVLAHVERVDDAPPIGFDDWLDV